MVVYHCDERIGEILLPLFFCITFTIMKKCYPGEPLNIYLQSLIDIILENNWVITTKKGKCKLPLFCGNREWIIPIYAAWIMPCFCDFFHPFPSVV